VLHQMISGDQFEGALMQGAPQIEFEKTELLSGAKIVGLTF